MNTQIVIPLAVETGESWNLQAIQFVQDLGRRISEVTNESMETQYLFQRIWRSQHFNIFRARSPQLFRQEWTITSCLKNEDFLHEKNAPYQDFKIFFNRLRGKVYNYWVPEKNFGNKLSFGQ